MNSAINFKSIGYNLTILANDNCLSSIMKIIEEQIKKGLSDEIRWDICVATMRHNLKNQYERFLKNPSLRDQRCSEWDDFISQSISYFFTDAYFYNRPIRLVSPDFFEQVITKGIYVNLTNVEKPDLVEDIDYIKYVKVGGR